MTPVIEKMALALQIILKIIAGLKEKGTKPSSILAVIEDAIVGAKEIHGDAFAAFTEDEKVGRILAGLKGVVLWFETEHKVARAKLYKLIEARAKEDRDLDAADLEKLVGDAQGAIDKLKTGATIPADEGDLGEPEPTPVP